MNVEDSARTRGVSFSGTGGGPIDGSIVCDGVGLTCWGCRPFLYLSASSPILALRNAMGMRLTRISIRVRSPWAWRLYCARSFRARSVTVDALDVAPSWYVLAQLRPHTFELEVVNERLLLAQ